MLLKHASVQVISCLEGDQQIITNEFGIAESPNLNLVGWSESSSGFFTFPWQHQMDYVATAPLEKACLFQ